MSTKQRMPRLMYSGLSKRIYQVRRGRLHHEVEGVKSTWIASDKVDVTEDFMGVIDLLDVTQTVKDAVLSALKLKRSEVP